MLAMEEQWIQAAQSTCASHVLAHTELNCSGVTTKQVLKKLLDTPIFDLTASVCGFFSLCNPYLLSFKHTCQVYDVSGSKEASGRLPGGMGSQVLHL
jgi:hypothetical protein